MKTYITKTALAAFTLGFAATGTLVAHTPYLLPNVFSASNAMKKVTATSSFTEAFFVPEFRVESDDFFLIDPNGERREYGNVTVLDQITILENDLEERGTYKLSTGKRLGRKFKMKRVEDGWDYVRSSMEEGAEDEPLPEGVEVADFQSQTVAEAYVTKGPPTKDALEAEGVGLEIVPLTHPSEIYLDSGFEYKLVFNGEPVARHDMMLYRSGGDYEEPKFGDPVTTDEDGAVALSFDKPGVYLVMTRFQGEAPADSETPYRSYTTTLTFEVIR